jgi:cob(I)alamin adenosyltransferase
MTDMQEFALMCAVEELASTEMDRESIRRCERQLSRHKHIKRVFEDAGMP